MAKITVSGRTATIVSNYSLEDFEKLESYRPDALLLKDEDGDVYFKVGLSCQGSVSDYGIGFNDETFGSKKACVTVAPSCSCYDTAEEMVIGEIGSAILNLNKVERQIPAALDDIDAELEEIKASIEVQ